MISNHKPHVYTYSMNPLNVMLKTYNQKQCSKNPTKQVLDNISQPPQVLVLSDCPQHSPRLHQRGRNPTTAAAPGMLAIQRPYKKTYWDTPLGISKNSNKFMMWIDMKSLGSFMFQTLLKMYVQVLVLGCFRHVCVMGLSLWRQAFTSAPGSLGLQNGSCIPATLGRPALAVSQFNAHTAIDWKKNA